MNVRFRSRQLLRRYERHQEAERAWGTAVARKYIQRVSLLYAADHLHDLFALRALRLHPLKGERAGQYAMTLHERWRLIVTLEDEGRTAVVEEVTNHYGD